VAALHAHRAVLNRHETSLLDLLDAAVSAGTAVELLAKACVAAVEPALLAASSPGRGSPETQSILRLRGHRGRVGDSSAVRDVSTVFARQAVALAAELHAEITISPRELTLLFDVRNAAVHLGRVQDDLLLEAVVDMARFAEQALAALGQDSDGFWTPHVGTW